MYCTEIQSSKPDFADNFIPNPNRPYIVEYRYPNDMPLQEIFNSCSWDTKNKNVEYERLKPFFKDLKFYAADPRSHIEELDKFCYYGRGIGIHIPLFNDLNYVEWGLASFYLNPTYDWQEHMRWAHKMAHTWMNYAHKGFAYSYFEKFGEMWYDKDGLLFMVLQRTFDNVNQKHFYIIYEDGTIDKTLFNSNKDLSNINDTAIHPLLKVKKNGWNEFYSYKVKRIKVGYPYFRWKRGKKRDICTLKDLVLKLRKDNEIPTPEFVRYNDSLNDNAQ